MKNYRVIVSNLRVILPVIAGVLLSAPTEASNVVAWGNNNFNQTTMPLGLANVKAISAGGNHSLALRSDGTVVTWGYNAFGLLDAPASLTGVIAISSGRNHNLALKADGTMTAWGLNASGVTNMPPGLTDIVSISAGGDVSLALRSDGTVAAWGNESLGLTNYPPGMSNVVAVAAGESHALALTGSGRVLGWGANLYGESSVPTELSNVTAIAASVSVSMALRADGTVMAWGYGERGQTNIPPGLSNVVEIAAGGSFCLARRANGSVVGWDPTPGWIVPTVPAALTNATAIAAGYLHALALVNADTVQFTSQPRSLVVGYGSNATFFGSATGLVPLNYQWLRNGQRLADSGRISGSTNTTLTISNTVISDMAAYALQVTTPLGSVNSTGAVLTVISPPFFTSQSATTRTVRAGTTLTLFANGDGTPPLAYQWLRNGTNLPGRTSLFINFLDVQPAASGIYSLVVTNIYGSAQADFSMTVTDSPPYIVQQPFVRLPDQGSSATTTNPVVPLGGSTTLNVEARGTTPLTYQWRFQGVDIPGATNTTLALSNLVASQTGYYSVEVQNAFGSVISAKLFLNVVQVYVGSLSQALNATNLTWVTNWPPGSAWFPQSSETHGDNGAGQSGAANNGPSSLQTTITGPGTLTFWWKVSSEEGYDFLSFYYDSVNTPVQRISGETGWFVVTQAVTSGTHTFRWTYSKDATVTVGRDAGWLDEVAYTPVMPVWISQPASLAVTRGNNVLLSGEATGPGPVSYQWLWNGTNLASATTNQLGLIGVGRSRSGNYTLRATSGGGTILSSNALLRVRVPHQLSLPLVQPDGSLLVASMAEDGVPVQPAELNGFAAEMSDDFATWTNFTGVLSLTNGSLQLLDPDGTSHPQRFYRIFER